MIGLERISQHSIVCRRAVCVRTGSRPPPCIHAVRSLTPSPLPHPACRPPLPLPPAVSYPVVPRYAVQYDVIVTPGCNQVRAGCEGTEHLVLESVHGAGGAQSSGQPGTSSRKPVAASRSGDARRGNGCGSFCRAASPRFLAFTRTPASRPYQAFLNALLAVCDVEDRVVLFKPYYFDHLMAMQVCRVVY